MSLSPSTVEHIKLAYPVSEAAPLLSISRARLYELLGDGTIPSVKIGRSRRIRREALVEYLDSLGNGPDEAA